MTPAQRFAAALLASLLAHVVVLFPLHWPFWNEPIAGQVHLSVQLRSATPAPAEKPVEATPGQESTVPDRGDAAAPDKTNRLTAPGGPPVATAPAAAPAGGRVQEARVVEQPAPPEYPREARQRRLEGCVLAVVSVNDAGGVDDVRIIASDHPGIFDQAVADSQKAARYLPAMKNGEAVASRVLTAAAFVLEPGRRLNCALRYAAQAEKIGGGASP